MICHGQPPFLECSTKGDKRFSAFAATVDGQSIETRYQAAKVFEDGSTGLEWRAAKGRKAANQSEIAHLYSKLWDQYIAEHPELLNILLNSNGLCDTFGQRGHVCQATELWRIRNEYIQRERDSESLFSSLAENE